MSLPLVAIIGGVWMSLLYAAAVMPATVWVIQLTVSRGWWSGTMAGLGLALGQVPWVLAAGLLLFALPQVWQAADLWLRLATAAFMVWLAVRNLRAGRVQALQLVVQGSNPGILLASLWRSLTMPWRLPLWAGLVISISVHLRGPGLPAAPLFTLGTIAGQLGWYLHFIVIAALFGRRVPEDISLHSMNKLRLLAGLVPAGLAVVVLAPLALTLS